MVLLGPIFDLGVHAAWVSCCLFGLGFMCLLIDSSLDEWCVVTALQPNQYGTFISMTKWTVGHYSSSDINTFHSGWHFFFSFFFLSFFFSAKTRSFRTTKTENKASRGVSFLPSNAPPSILSPEGSLTRWCYLDALVASRVTGLQRSI